MIAARAIREFVRCVCAYFEDMKKCDPDCVSLHHAIDAAKTELKSLEKLAEKLPFLFGLIAYFYTMIHS